MIELSKTSITIDAPTPVVFKYVSNMENYKRWFPGVVDIKSANNLEHGVIGKEYVEKLSLPSGESELIIEVDQCDTNQLFLTKGDLAGILPQMTITFFVDEDKRCEMTLQYHSRNPELAEVSDIIIVLREDLNVRAKKGLAKLKYILEKN